MTNFKKQTQNLFYLIFSILLIFSIFLIETEYKYALFSIWQLFLLFYIYFFEIKLQLKKDILIFFLFITSLILSTLNSTIFYLSLDKLLFYLVSFSIYLFFRSAPSKLINKEKISKSLLLVTSLTNSFVIVANFLDNIKNAFPGMNILVNTYGHNHYSAFLLLIIPIIWESLLKKKNLANIFLIISSYLILFISMGRVALFIGLIQIVLLIAIKNSIISNQKNSRLIKILLTFLSISIVSFLLIGFFTEKTTCPFSGKENLEKICQPITSNDRRKYWKKAILMSKGKVIFGYGLNTFFYSERLLPTEEVTGTSYSHNIFIHLLVEAGVFSAALFLLFFINFYQNVKNSERKSEDCFLLIAISSSLLNACLDFDFNFFVIFVITLIFIAIYFDKKKNIKAKTSLFPINILVLLITIILLINHLLGLYFLKRNETEKTTKLIANHYIKKEITNKTLPAEQDLYERLFKQYQNDYSVLTNIYQRKNIDQKLKSQIAVKLVDINLMQLIKIISFSDLEPQTQNIIIQKLLDEIELGLDLTIEGFLTWNEKINISDDLFKIAEINYLNNNLKESNNAYKLAIYFNQGVLTENKISLLEENDLNKALNFLKETNINPQYFYDYEFAFTNIINNVLSYLFYKEDFNNFYLIANKYKLFENHNSQFKKDQSFYLLKNFIDNYQNNKQKNELKKMRNSYKKSNIWERLDYEYRESPFILNEIFL